MGEPGCQLGVQAVTDAAAEAWLLLLILLVPLCLACGMLLWPRKSVLLLLAPWAAAPALTWSLVFSPGHQLHLPWLLLGATLGVDGTAQTFLFFAGLLWLTAGVFAAGYLEKGQPKTRFFTYFLLAMTGNLGLILAQDMLSFYMFFALMSFASYGLVVHDRTAEARRAGRIYILMVVAGEVMLFAAMVLAANVAGSILFDDVRSALAEGGTRDLIFALALCGLGIKLGVLGLHVWLPLAHPVAPTPASAVLSVTMIKAGLLGWLRLFPFGETALPTWWSAILMATGLTAMFYAAIVGFVQRNPKTVLAYSSVSQMGLVTAGAGLGLAVPARWPEISAVILFLALHHALAKSALFLGAGLSTAQSASNGHRWLLATGLSLAALALAGAPFTSGGLVKEFLKVEAMAAPQPWATPLQTLLPWTGIATVLLMVRFLYLAWPRASSTGVRLNHRLSGAWAVLIVALLLAPFYSGLQDTQGAWTLSKTISGLATLAMGGAAAALAAWGLATAYRRRIPLPPAGDLVVPVETAAARMLGLLLHSLKDFGRKRDQGTAAVRMHPGRLWKPLQENGSAEFAWTSGSILFLAFILLFMAVSAM